MRSGLAEVTLDGLLVTCGGTVGGDPKDGISPWWTEPSLSAGQLSNPLYAIYDSYEFEILLAALQRAAASQRESR